MRHIILTRLRAKLIRSGVVPTFPQLHDCLHRQTLLRFELNRGWSSPSLLKGCCAMSTDHLGVAAGGAPQLFELLLRIALLLQNPVFVLYQAPHLGLRSLQLLPAGSAQDVGPQATESSHADLSDPKAAGAFQQ